MKIRNLIVLFAVAVAGAAWSVSCTDDYDFDISAGDLLFSRDTLHLDTVFTLASSQTYSFTVHNHQNKNVYFPRVYLSKGENSLFKMNVDGIPGYDIPDVDVRKKDSIFVFVEIQADDFPQSGIYEDEINFETDNGIKQVKLMAYLEKAKFYNPDGQPVYQIGDQTWDKEYARVLYGTVAADNLTIGPGTRIYFHKDANLRVSGDLNVQGNIAEKVVFRTDRMDERADSLPDNWGKIHLRNSVNSKMDYAIIRGGSTGLEVENSKIEITNTRIFNNEKTGLLARGNNSKVTGKNLVINNSNLASLELQGGKHEFVQCTFANYFYIGQGAGQNLCLILSDKNTLQQANFYNSIFYGRSLNAIQIDEGVSNYVFEYNVIRSDAGNQNFSATNILDENPEFVDPGYGKNDLRLREQEESAIPYHGNPTYILGDSVLEKDILGDSRLPLPTPGAYQELVPEED